MVGFEKASTVLGAAGAYEAQLDPQWTVGGRPHGGYLLAVLANAALAEDAGAEHPHPLSASAVYMSPPDVGPARVTVETLRRGRTASQLRARLAQGDRVRVEALFTLGRLDGSAEVLYVDAPPPEVTAEEELTRSPVSPPGSGLHIAMLEAVDQRVDYSAVGEPPGEFRGWLRFADGQPFDPVSLLYAVDSFPPATFTLGSVGWVPTLELTAYVRAVPRPGPPRVRQHARLLAGSIVDQVCEVWDSSGRLVAQATQLATVRMAPKVG